jgi:hypothetical protein
MITIEGKKLLSDIKEAIHFIDLHLETIGLILNSQILNSND